MAIIPCPECKSGISERATTCPHCGSPSTASKHKKNRVWLWILGVVFVLPVVLFFGTAIVAGILDATSDKAADAERVIRNQVASDIQVAFDRHSAQVYRNGIRTSVCGYALLNRPGSGPLALNNSRQRVIVNLVDGRGFATFDGSSSAAGQAEFQDKWDNDCVSR